MSRLKIAGSGILLLVGLAMLMSINEPMSNTLSVLDQSDLAIVEDIKTIDTSRYNLQKMDSNDYQQDLISVKLERLRIQLKYQGAPSDIIRNGCISSGGKAIEESLINSVFHHWYGTPWDFDGYTNTPNKGVIACGYFVSTTMKHIGFNVNRYRLAQQNPMNEALSISAGDPIQELVNLTSQEVLDSISKLDSGLYFVGLDNHVGYLLIRQATPFFIHSNYIGDGGVCIELASQSEAFLGSGAYVITQISNNKTLVKKWLTQEEIVVVTLTD
jgi:hypothetical protein